MAELIGNDSHVDAFSSQLGGAGVPQAVAVNSLLDASPSTEFGEESPDVAVAQDSPKDRC